LVSAEFSGIERDFCASIFATQISATHGHTCDCIGTHGAFNKLSSSIISKITKEEITVNVDSSSRWKLY